MSYKSRHDCDKQNFGGRFTERRNPMNENLQPREFHFQEVLSALQPTIEAAWERASRDFQLNIGEANPFVHSSQNSTSAKSVRYSLLIEEDPSRNQGNEIFQILRICKLILLWFQLKMAQM